MAKNNPAKKRDDLSTASNWVNDRYSAPKEKKAQVIVVKIAVGGEIVNLVLPLFSSDDK
jgi:hypothetical protein